ncbi:MAG: addiction module protein [Gammaproteobacteria bacterium]|nr:addiction module protein [Gammaproteobacteria bacterium]
MIEAMVRRKVMTIAELEEELLKLSEPEKKQLLRRLIADLDEGRDEDVKRAWLEEAQRRYKELKDGVVRVIPAEEAIARAKERLRNVR